MGAERDTEGLWGRGALPECGAPPQGAPGDRSGAEAKDTGELVNEAGTVPKPSNLLCVFTVWA